MAWRFLQGLLAGASGVFICVGVLAAVLHGGDATEAPAPEIPITSTWLTWALDNLGWSMPVFAILLVAFLVTLVRLRTLLASNAPVTQVVQLDHLADIWTTLFFGTGVIWTAIGMRSALIYALGDRELALASGAFAMLERMIDGGILLALSTTIVGGVGGYLMRVCKTMSLGSDLTRRYDEAARADTVAMRDSLKRIERRLEDSGDAEGRAS